MGIQEIFIENLKFFRKERKISQKDLSIQIDKSFNYINGIEGGVSFPPPAVIDQIAEILRIDASQLFSPSSSPKNIIDSYRHKFSKSLETELCEQVTKSICNVCRRLG